MHWDPKSSSPGFLQPPSKSVYTWFDHPEVFFTFYCSVNNSKNAWCTLASICKKLKYKKIIVFLFLITFAEENLFDLRDMLCLLLLCVLVFQVADIFFSLDFSSEKIVTANHFNFLFAYRYGMSTLYFKCPF